MFRLLVVIPTIYTKDQIGSQVMFLALEKCLQSERFGGCNPSLSIQNRINEKIKRKKTKIKQSKTKNNKKHWQTLSHSQLTSSKIGIYFMFEVKVSYLHMTKSINY